jgi:uncharacterized protein YhfF
MARGYSDLFKVPFETQLGECRGNVWHDSRREHVSSLLLLLVINGLKTRACTWRVNVIYVASSVKYRD